MPSYITYRYRLYPNQAQRRGIDTTISACRFLYNAMLTDKINQYEHTGKVISFPPDDYLTQYPVLKEIDPGVLSYIQKHLDADFRASDYAQGKYPRFRKTKSRGSYIAIGAVLKGNRLALPKIGAVKVKVHRQAPNQKPLKTTIVRTAAGEYYVSFLYVCPERNNHIFLPITQELTLGLDFSVPKFYVDSDGNSPDHPHFQEEALPQIKRMRAAMSRKQKGSANYEKLRRKLARLHQHTRNRRLDWLHKESRRLADRYDTIVTETLNIHAIAQTFHLGIRTLDNAYATFQQMLAYKLKAQGKHFYKLNPYTPSSQTCSQCGYINRNLTLSDRFWTCPKCGKLVSRDHNAAINIKNRITRLHW